jgi:uncharacterized membrane protein YoaK (UPF0700 family)
MMHTDRRVTLLAAWLSALAGFVDATAFLALGGFFVSFMSGNTTRLAVDLADGARAAGIAGALIALFVTGVVMGTMAGRAGGPRRAVFVLGLVTLLLALAALAGSFDFLAGAAILMALAMGAENAVFERDGEVQIGLTYMTGTLVKLGQHLTRAMTGGPRWAWRPYLLLWLGLAGGAVAGALCWPHLELNGLWLAALMAAIGAGFAARVLQGDLE